MAEQSDPIPQSLLDKLFASHPERFVLPNGLTVILQEDHANPLISCQVWVKTGSIHEGAWLGSGLSHFLEHMLFKGTARRSPGTISKEVQALGGMNNAYTAFDRTVYFIDGPSDQAAHILDILADMTLAASLPDEEVLKEREVILREIDMTLDDPDRQLARTTLETAFRTYPFRHPVIGRRPLFEQVSRNELQQYYQSRYTPNNMVLSVAGDISRDSLESVLEDTFAQHPPRPVQPVCLNDEPAQLAPREIRIYGDYQIARGSLAYPIPSLRHPDAPALDLLAAVLSGGHSGFLKRHLKDEEGIVHSINAASWNPGNHGLFWINYHTEPDLADKAESAILESLNKVAKSGISEQNLAKAKRFAIVGEIQSRNTLNGMASKHGLLEAIVGDIFYPATFLKRLKNVSVDDLRDLINRYFVPERQNAVTINTEDHRPVQKTALRASRLPRFESATLHNGARLVYQQDHRLPRVHLRYTGLGGPLFEDKRDRGATSLLATMLTRDTEFRSAKMVAETIESVGGFLNENSGNNSFSISAETLPEDAETGLKLIEEGILYPSFLTKTFERERDIQIATVRDSLDDVVDYGRRSLRSNFFVTHPFASDPLGSPDTLKNITLDVLNSYYLRLINARNAVFTVVGDFDPDVLIPQIQAFLLNLPQSAFRPAEIDFNGPPQPGRIEDSLPREQAVVFDAFPDCGVTDQDYLTGEVLDEIFNDMAGPLFNKVREDQSLAYFVGATRLLGLHYGMFSLYAGTHPSTIEQVFATFDEELNRVREGRLDQESFNHARNRLKVQKQTQLQSAAFRATQASLNALFDKPVEDWLELDKQLEALSTQDITQFANKYLDESSRVRLSILP